MYIIPFFPEDLIQSLKVFEGISLDFSSIFSEWVLEKIADNSNSDVMGRFPDTN